VFVTACRQKCSFVLFPFVGVMVCLFVCLFVCLLGNLF